MNTNTFDSHLILHPDNPLCKPYDALKITEIVEIINSQHQPQPQKKRRKRVIKNPCKCKNDTSRLCIACTEKPKDYMCFPCGHVCFCEECFKKFVDPNTYKKSNESDEYISYSYSSISNYCPVCRDYISRIIKIYF